MMATRATAVLLATQAQGLQMCYSKEALNALPATHIWPSPAVWNHSQYVAMAAMSDSIKRAGLHLPGSQVMR